MTRFDKYVNSNDTPKTLCKEIEELQKKYDELNDFSNSQLKIELIKNEKLQKQIEKMKCCCNCENISVFTEEDPCKSCGKTYKHWKLKERKNEK